MEYREQSPPPGLELWIKTQWTLDCGGAPDTWIEHQAVPDGCIELIWPTQGRSFWQGEQPAAFACGLISKPAELRFSGDARFTALRLWPWAWHALGLQAASSFLDGWIPLPRELTGSGRVEGHLADASSDAIAKVAGAIIGTDSIAGIVAATGHSHRWLQRWFAARVGIPPRLYLRLLRFQNAFAGVQADSKTLAGHAADHGYADQAHMAREFRTLAKAPARSIRKVARGPFV